MTTYNDYSIELRSYLTTLRKHGFKILTCSNDGGYEIAATFSEVSFDEFVEECMGADDCYLVCLSPFQCRTEIYFVFGNSCGEIASDYTYTLELDPVNAEHAKNWDGKQVPTMEG